MTPDSRATTTPKRYSIDDLPEIDRTKIAPNPETGCWEWTAARRKDGYGQVNRLGRNLKAHRHVYETLVGPLPVNTHHLDHLCRVRWCVNPGHLEPVTPIENSRRGLSAIQAELPNDLLRNVVRLVEQAYKRGVYEGLRQAGVKR